MFSTGDIKGSSEAIAQAREYLRLSGARPDKMTARLYLLQGTIFGISGAWREACASYLEGLGVLNSLTPPANTEICVATVALALAEGSVLGKDAYNKRMCEAFAALDRCTVGDQIETLKELQKFVAIEVSFGRFETASGLLDAVNIVVESLGARADLIVPQIRQLQGAVQAHLGNWERAQEFQSMAVTLLENRFGPDSPTVLSARTNLARLLIAGGKPVRAEAMIVKNLRTLEGNDRSHPSEQIAEALLELARFQITSCKFHDASECITRVRQIVPPEVADTNPSLLDLEATVLFLSGSLDGSLRKIEQALALPVRFGMPSLELRSHADFYVDKARILLKQKEFSQASECLEHAKRIPAHPLEHLTPRLGYILLVEAELAAAFGNFEQAGELLRRAHREAKGSRSTVGSTNEVPFLNALAEFEAEHGDGEIALQLLEQSHAILMKQGRSGHIAMLQTLKL